VRIGDKVRATRKAAGISQEEVARRAGVSLNVINRLERGVILDPHYSTLRGIASALGVPVEDLVREPALAGKADAPETGPSLLDKALGAAQRDAQLDAQARARLFASEGEPQRVASYQEDKFRAELRTLGFPDERFEDFVWPLVELAAKTKQLEDQLAACEEERRLLMNRV
jgi:transcriptional regulator with XRE-family HTH domain